MSTRAALFAIFRWLGLTTLAPVAVAAPVLPAFFDPDSAASLRPMIVLRQAAPPKNNLANHLTYAFGPITGSWLRNTVVQNASSWRSSNPGQEAWINIWANRARTYRGGRALKPNPIFPNIALADGRRGWVEFSSIARANAATEAEVLYTVGAPATAWQAPLAAAGVKWAPWAAVTAATDNYFPRQSDDGTGPVATDLFIVPPEDTIARSPFAISLDYEVHDGRPARGADSTQAFLDDMVSIIHRYGLKAYLFTNPWDGPLMPGNGFSREIIDDIMQNWDYVSNLVYHKNVENDESRQYEYGLRYMSGSRGQLDMRKVIVTFDLTDSDAQACMLHQKYERDHFGGFIILASGVPEGGADQFAPGSANLKITELLFGHGRYASCP